MICTSRSLLEQQVLRPQSSQQSGSDKHAAHSRETMVSGETNHEKKEAGSCMGVSPKLQHWTIWRICEYVTGEQPAEKVCGQGVASVQWGVLPI